MAGVEYQVTKVDPTDPQTKGAVYQVHKVSEEVAATLGGKVYRARIINDPTEPTVVGKVYQIVLIGDPDDPAVKGKVYNAILTGGSEAVVVGPAVSPLALDDAIADTMEYVKAFGGTEQDGTPTPDAPMDIVCNNGVLKARHQSGLPLGYTLLDYIESSGTQYIDTGIKVTQNDRVEVRYCYHTDSSVGTSGRIAGGRYTSGSPRDALALGSQNGKADPTTNMFSQFGTGGTAYAGPRIVIGDWFTAKSSADGYYVNDTAYQAPIPTGDFETPYTVKLFAFEQSAPGGDPTVGCGVGRCADFKIYTNNVLMMDLVPVKNSSNVIGMYDLVSGQFFTNQGTGDFVAGTAVSDPVEIYTDGTVETIDVHGKNLFDKNSVTPGYYYTNTGVYAQSTEAGLSDWMAVSPNTTYTITTELASGSVIGANRRVNYFDSNKNWLSQDVARMQDDTKVFNITTPSNAKYLRISYPFSGIYALDNNATQIEQGSTATEYAPYYDGGTATAEMLLKVGDYQDEQEILSGVVTRNVGVKVLDGTEGWVANTVSSGRLVFYVTKVSIGSDSTVLPSGSPNIKCSHFETSTAAAQSLYGTVWAGGTAINFTAGDFCANLTAWKQWLAAQYAAGTPVIVIYPLATPTTESVAGQTLQVTDGDNVLEITQASLNGLELEAEYEKEA